MDFKYCKLTITIVDGRHLVLISLYYCIGLNEMKPMLQWQ